MTLTRVYFGKPEGKFGLQALPAIPVGPPVGGSAGMSVTFGRGAVAQTKVSGGTSSARKPVLKSGYGLQWKIRGPADIDLLRSFFDGRQAGPYCLIDPSEQNYLPPNVASMGLVTGALATQDTVEWSPHTGAIAVSSQAGPTGLLTGVANWTGAGNGSILYMGLDNQIDGTWLPPILAGKSHRMAIYAKMLSGSASLTAAVLHGAGGASSPSAATATASTVALSSSWQEVSALVASSFSWTSTSKYVMMRLTVSSSSSPSILLAAASMQYDQSAALVPWVAGIGVPRVVIPDTAPSPVGKPGLRDWTMNVAEV